MIFFIKVTDQNNFIVYLYKQVRIAINYINSEQFSIII
jgi:hypothetical protein